MVPKVKRRYICSKCGQGEKSITHQHPKKSFGHKFISRLQTVEEAYYWAGYHDGYEKAVDKIHWGPGWD